MSSRAELKRRIMCRDLGKCRFAGCLNKKLEMAHRIADTESNKKYIQKYLIDRDINISLKEVRDKIIDHPFNVVIACDKHNAYFNIGFNRVETNSLIDIILDDLKI